MTRFVRALFALVVVLTAGSTYAQSSKAAWRFNELIDLSANSGGTTDTDWQDILTTQIKTPNGKELAIGASLQCGIVTDTTVRSKNGELDSAAARAKIAVRIQIVDPAGDTWYAEPNTGAALAGMDPTLPIELAEDGVTYCDRYQMLAAKFSGLDCTADLETGAVTCEDPEELRLLLSTLNAHHFNFLYANARPGVHTVTVQARAQAGSALGGTQFGAAGAEAFVGAGALSVETIRLVQDATGANLVELN